MTNASETMTKAKKFKIFDENGKELKSYKNVGNLENEQESFSIVKNGYQVIQHGDVYKTVEEAIADKNLNANIRPHRDFDGSKARLHIEVTFDDITLDIDNDGLQSKLYCSYDNSYDGTTGLRLSVGARRGNAILWVVGSKYYHKHTANVSVASFEDSLEKGIDSFQTKIKDHFKDMFKTPTTNHQAESFLESCLGIKDISKIYIDPIISKVKISSIKNKWQLYCLICEVLTEKTVSIDVRDRHLRAIIGRLHRVIKSTNEKSESPPTPEGGATLKDAVNSQVKTTAPTNIVSLITTPQKLTIDRKNKNKFLVMLGDTQIKSFKKYRQASRYVHKSA